MKAYVLYGKNDLRQETVPIPRLKTKEVLIEVKTAGICGSDIPRIFDTGAHYHPLIPGHEFAGIVTEVGKEACQDWLGKKVGIFPLIPCMECSFCKQGKYELCRNYSYLGSRRDGGFAQYVAVPEWNLIQLPDSVSFEAAAMLEPMAVTVHAMRGIALGKMDTVAVCGLGTIGLLLVQMLKERGVHNLYVIGKKAVQKRIVEKAGLCDDEFCNSQTDDVPAWIMEKTGGCGVDVFFECVGKAETIRQGITCTAPGGRIQLIGNPASDILLEKNLFWNILRKQLTIKGSWNSTFAHSEEDDWHYVLERIENGGIRPEDCVTHRLPFQELQMGLGIMRHKLEDYGKIMTYL